MDTETEPTDSACPCGSGLDLAGCCGPWLDGGDAPTALALMRSRYTAYVRGAVDHLVRTHDPGTRTRLDVDAVRRWSRDTQWLGLEILSAARGAEADADGIVEFVARGVTHGAPFAQRERSRFRRGGDGAWYYVDGDVVQEPVRRAAPVGRNEPCPCGSGQKYKRCHGA
jgi:SEC-C motif-containing protein